MGVPEIGLLLTGKSVPRLVGGTSTATKHWNGTEIPELKGRADVSLAWMPILAVCLQSRANYSQFRDRWSVTREVVRDFNAVSYNDHLRHIIINTCFAVMFTFPAVNILFSTWFQSDNRRRDVVCPSHRGLCRQTTLYANLSRDTKSSNTAARPDCGSNDLGLPP